MQRRRYDSKVVAVVDRGLKAVIVDAELGIGIPGEEGEVPGGCQLGLSRVE